MSTNITLVLLATVALAFNGGQKLSMKVSTNITLVLLATVALAFNGGQKLSMKHLDDDIERMSQKSR